MSPSNGPDRTSEERAAEERAADDRAADERDGVISPLRFLSGGLEFAVICAAGALAGRWLDGRLGTEPWFTAGLLIAAFATATWLLLRALSNTITDDGHDDGARR